MSTSSTQSDDLSRKVSAFTPRQILSSFMRNNDKETAKTINRSNLAHLELLLSKLLLAVGRNGGVGHWWPTEDVCSSGSVNAVREWLRRHTDIVQKRSFLIRILHQARHYYLQQDVRHLHPQLFGLRKKIVGGSRRRNTGRPLIRVSTSIFISRSKLIGSSSRNCKRSKHTDNFAAKSTLSASSPSPVIHEIVDSDSDAATIISIASSEPDCQVTDCSYGPSTSSMPLGISQCISTTAPSSSTDAIKSSPPAPYVKVQRMREADVYRYLSEHPSGLDEPFSVTTDEYRNLNPSDPAFKQRYMQFLGLVDVSSAAAAKRPGDFSGAAMQLVRRSPRSHHQLAVGTLGAKCSVHVHDVPFSSLGGQIIVSQQRYQYNAATARGDFSQRRGATINDLRGKSGLGAKQHAAVLSANHRSAGMGTELIGRRRGVIQYRRRYRLQQRAKKQARTRTAAQLSECLVQLRPLCAADFRRTSFGRAVVRVEPCRT